MAERMQQTVRKMPMNFLTMKPVCLSLAICLPLIPNIAFAQCQNFVASNDFDLAGAISEVNQSNVTGDQRDDNSFTEVWSKYTLGPIPYPSDILVGIALGYKAVEGEYHAAALGSFERAFVSINDGNLCETKLLHFLVFSGRTASTYAVLQSHPEDANRNVLGAGTYLTMTSNLNRPEQRLVSSDLGTLACLVREFSVRENMAELQEAISACHGR